MRHRKPCALGTWAAEQEHLGTGACSFRLLASAAMCTVSTHTNFFCGSDCDASAPGFRTITHCKVVQAQVCSSGRGARMPTIIR